MLKRKAIQTCAIMVACTATSVISTGCRSVPGAGMFARRGPSADALAGSGPSTTYPVPPSHNATPEAIASIAGGTSNPQTPSAAESATAQVAGIEISPGVALTPGADAGGAGLNMAAAEANGVFSGAPSGMAPPSFASGPAPTGIGVPSVEPLNDASSSLELPTGFGGTDTDSPSAALGSPSGYAFGTKAMTPKPTMTSAPDTMAAAGTQFAPPSGPVTPPSTAMADLPSTNYTQPPSSAGGFTLPGDGPAMTALAPPSGSQDFPVPAGVDATASATMEPPSGFAPPSTFAPTEIPSDVSAPAEVTAPSFGPDFSTARAPESPESGGYTPGSTGSAGGYPTDSSAPTTRGSFYR